MKKFMKHKPKIKYTKLDLEKEQKKRDKEILIAYKLISKIIKRKFKLNKNKLKNGLNILKKNIEVVDR